MALGLGVGVLSDTEGTVATSAATVWVWRSGARVGRRPRSMATVAMFYTVTLGFPI